MSLIKGVNAAAPGRSAQENEILTSGNANLTQSSIINHKSSIQSPPAVTLHVSRTTHAAKSAGRFSLPFPRLAPTMRLWIRRLSEMSMVSPELEEDRTMTNRRKTIDWLLLICLVSLAGWLWYPQLRKPVWKIVEVGTRLTGDDLGFIRPEVRARLVSEGFHISSRTLVIVPPKPGVLFGTVRKPGSQEEFTYLMLFRYGRRLRGYGGIISRDMKLLCTFDGTVAETNDRFTVNGKPIEASYRLELNEARTAVANESLTIGGERADIAAGRVFLIDLTVESPVYQQMKVELPAIPARLETRDDAERAAEAIRESLETQNPKIKAFLR